MNRLDRARVNRWLPVVLVAVGLAGLSAPALTQTQPAGIDPQAQEIFKKPTDYPAGLEYYNCAPGVYYRAVVQGNNLVYESAQS